MPGQDYVGQRVTLNGEPAIIAGRRNRFGSVAVCSPGSKWNGAGFEYAWETIARIVETKEGRFES